MATLTIEVPDEALENVSPEAIKEAERAALEEFIIHQRQEGHISLGRAAKLLGVSIYTFRAMLGKRGLPIINASQEELQADYKRNKKV